MSGFDGIENPLPTSSNSVSMNCNKPIAFEQTSTISDGVIVGVGSPVSPVISPRMLAGIETGMMLEIGGRETGRVEISPRREANTPDATGGTAIGLPVAPRTVMDVIASDPVGGLRV